MKAIGMMILVFAALSGFSQNTIAKDSIFSPNTFSEYKDLIVLDSFSFCRLRFSIFRDCNQKSEAACCSHTIYPPQVGCNNGVSLFWTYLPTQASAEMNLESLVMNLERRQKKFKKEIIYCNLLGIRLKAYRVNCTTTENHRWSEIITAGVINGQSVLVEFNSGKPIYKNKAIQPIFQQLISLDK